MLTAFLGDGGRVGQRSASDVPTSRHHGGRVAGAPLPNLPAHRKSLADVLNNGSFSWLDYMREDKYSLDGETLSIDTLIEIVYFSRVVCVSSESRQKMSASFAQLQVLLKKDTMIYGVNTNFGGLANQKIDSEQIVLLQKNLISGLKCGCGNPLKQAFVRAAMLLRANALAKGVSAVRVEIIERLLLFLNHNFIPVVPEFGSIGASGDLVPLSYIAGSIIGLSDRYMVETPEGIISCQHALDKLGLQPLELMPKEGLALVNGTSFMAGIAAINLHKTKQILNLTLIVNSFYLQALNADISPFCSFIHKNKPHEGQASIADILFHLLNTSMLLNKEESSTRLFQDRYSIRCLPQYLGPFFESIVTAQKQIEIELNSANDNPLFDAENNEVYHGGNFLGQHISFAMDQIRYSIGLLVKHLDVQIALLVTPEFSNGLPASLASYHNQSIDFGLKGLQIAANALMPLILYNCQPIAHLYPTHAEQYNQNINSQGYNSAILTAESIEKTYMYLSMSIIFALQSVDLRSKKLKDTYHSIPFLSHPLVPFYEMVSQLLQQDDNKNVPFIQRMNLDLDASVKRIADDLMAYDSKLHRTVEKIITSI